MPLKEGLVLVVGVSASGGEPGDDGIQEPDAVAGEKAFRTSSPSTVAVALSGSRGPPVSAGVAASSRRTALRRRDGAIRSFAKDVQFQPRQTDRNEELRQSFSCVGISTGSRWRRRRGRRTQSPLIHTRRPQRTTTGAGVRAESTASPRRARAGRSRAAVPRGVPVRREGRRRRAHRSTPYP